MSRNLPLHGEEKHFGRGPTSRQYVGKALWSCLRIPRYKGGSILAVVLAFSSPPDLLVVAMVVVVVVVFVVFVRSSISVFVLVCVLGFSRVL